MNDEDGEDIDDDSGDDQDIEDDNGDDQDIEEEKCNQYIEQQEEDNQDIDQEQDMDEGIMLRDDDVSIALSTMTLELKGDIEAMAKQRVMRHLQNTRKKEMKKASLL